MLIGSTLINRRRRWTMARMTTLIDVPPGLNGVAVTDTAIGDVLGAEGRFHYRGHDATVLARTRSFEEVWHLVAVGHLPDAAELAEFRAAAGRARSLPPSIAPVLEPLARAAGATLGRIRAALSIAVDDLGLRPMIDLAPDERAAQALRVAAVIPAITAALHRASLGLEPVAPDPDAGHAAAYLQMVTGEPPSAAAARAVEQYLILTIDHGFNASTFTARVVASTGADLADVVGAALGALAGPLHGGAPSRALDALDTIGDPDRTDAWVEAELAAGRRIMGFGHAVYRDVDPRSTLLREIAVGLGGDVVERAVDVEARVVAALRRAKPNRPLPSNVEFFAGVVMAAAGLPRSMFTPTFAVSRTVGWCAHAVEQAAQNKLIRPSSRYVGPSLPS
jgi:citrate synthase